MNGLKFTGFLQATPVHTIEIKQTLEWTPIIYSQLSQAAYLNSQELTPQNQHIKMFEDWGGSPNFRKSSEYFLKVLLLKLKTNRK